MKVAAVVSDLMLFSRIESAVRAAGAELTRVDSPSDIPPDAEVVLVDWSARQPHWADALRRLSGPRLVLFGPHTDLEAHAAARDVGLGPMWARSKLLGSLTDIMDPPVAAPDRP
jgi:hypothetical protein